MQHDYVISNGNGAAVRADINSVLQAIATLNAGATAPAATFPNMLWYDTANGVLWKRTNADDDWIVVATGLASQAEAEAGSDNAKFMTALRVAQAIRKHKCRVGTGTITDGELDIDALFYDVVNVTANDDFTLNLPTNGEAGDGIIIRITQDGTGSRVLTLGSGFLISSELAEDGIVLSTASGVIDKIGIRCVSAGVWDIDSFSTDYAEPA